MKRLGWLWIAVAIVSAGCGGSDHGTAATSAQLRSAIGGTNADTTGFGRHPSLSTPCWAVDYRWSHQVSEEMATLPNRSGTGCKRIARQGAVSRWRAIYWTGPTEVARCVLIVHRRIVRNADCRIR